ncbi:type VI secretion system tip protein TssI/VgrG [Rhizobium sp. ZPR3]|uniref:Type VI secretion system tip protein TssI/VgrG n=2 Tax=unclassified Rhizobium TaxID=2613769 RepID=A0AAU7SRD3_9HYPH
MALEELVETLASEGFSQVDRTIRIETVLGVDVLLAERLYYRAGINELFDLRVDVRAKQGEIDPKRLIATLADVSLEIGEGQRKTWNGLIQGVTAGPPLTRGGRAYTLVIRPQLFLLSQKSDWRTWQHLSSVDVAQTLLSEHGLPAPDVSGVIHQPKPMVYAVQAGETDLDYLTRRLEADGIFYYFRHEGGQKGSVSAKHVLVLADHQSGYDKPNDEADGKIRYALGSSDRNHINNWLQRFEYSPGRRTGADYNFLHVDIPTANAPSLIELNGNQKYELFEFGSVVGGYGVGSASEGIDSTEVEKQSRWRMQATEVDHNLTEGSSTVRTLEVGQKFQPYDVANLANTFEEMVIHKLEVSAHDHSYEAADQDAPEYSNRFVALPARVPATPHRTTSKPRIDGVHVGFIAGPEGEEIHTDQHGRIKLWMPWDRKAKKDGSDSPWIRVSQAWAGSTWGGQIIPRIGQEAMVAFIGGDPDRPVVLGLAPNAKHTVPYTLPANKTKSVFRTQTHKGNGFNELTFEDEKGREEIYMHAQRDHRVHVENSHSKRIDNNQAESIGHNKSIEVGNNHHEVIGGNMTLMVGPNILQKGVTAAMGILRDGVGNLLTSKLGGFTDVLGFLSQTTMGEGNMIVGVGKNKAETVMVSSTEIVGAAKTTTVGGGYQLTVGGVKNESVAFGSWEEVGQTKVTVVGHKYEIVCGKSRILMERDGTITLEGVRLIINKEERMTVTAGKIEMN